MEANSVLYKFFNKILIKMKEIFFLLLFNIFCFEVIAQKNSFFELSFEESFSDGRFEVYVNDEKAYQIDSLERLSRIENRPYIYLLFTPDYSDNTFIITSRQYRFRYSHFIYMNKKKWRKRKINVRVEWVRIGKTIVFTNAIDIKKGSFIEFYYNKECNCIKIDQRKQILKM